jgi:predicted secreted Zn-dependent protease
MTKGLLAMAVAGLVAIPAPTWAERRQGAQVEIEEQRQHFEIRGATAEELVRQMRALRPRKSAARRAWGLTTWDLSMEYVLVPEREGCRVSDARVRLEIATTLPKWRSIGRPSQQLRADWRDMLANLERHERTHRDHGVLAANAAAAGLSALPLQHDCAAARREAGQVLRNAMSASRQLSRQFDRDPLRRHRRRAAARRRRTGPAEVTNGRARAVGPRHAGSRPGDATGPAEVPGSGRDDPGLLAHVRDLDRT